MIINVLIILVVITTTTTIKEMGGEFGFLGDRGNEVYLKTNWNLIYISDLFVLTAGW